MISNRKEMGETSRLLTPRFGLQGIISAGMISNAKPWTPSAEGLGNALSKKQKLSVSIS